MVNIVLLLYVWLITGDDKYYITIQWMVDRYNEHYYN